MLYFNTLWLGKERTEKTLALTEVIATSLKGVKGVHAECQLIFVAAVEDRLIG